MEVEWGQWGKCIYCVLSLLIDVRIEIPVKVGKRTDTSMGEAALKVPWGRCRDKSGYIWCWEAGGLQSWIEELDCQV